MSDQNQPPTQSPPEEQSEKVNKQLQVTLNDSGAMAVKTMQEKVTFAQLALQSKMVPKGYKTVSEVLIGMQYAAELGLPTLSGLKNIAVINGMPSIWGDLPLALVKKSGHLASIDEIFLDQDYAEIKMANKNLHVAPYFAVCKTLRKGFEKIHETFFSLGMAKHAGLLSRDNVWKVYPARMLQMRARSQNLKDNFGDCLNGIAIAEYDFNYLPEGAEVRNVTRSGTTDTEVERVNEELLRGNFNQ